MEVVEVTVKTQGGQQYRLTEFGPPPFGSNPAFMIQEFDSALDSLRARFHNLLTVEYGRQQLR